MKLNLKRTPSLLSIALRILVITELTVIQVLLVSKRPFAIVRSCECRGRRAMNASKRTRFRIRDNQFIRSAAKLLGTIAAPNRPLIALAIFFMVVFSPAAQSQTSDQAVTTHYLQYFLDAPPPNIDHPNVPPGARDLIIAKVRNLEQPPTYLIGRRGSASPPSKDLFFTRIEIVDVLSGRAQAGAQYDVYFGVRGLGGPQFTYPHTPRQNAREYFVVSYVGDDDKRRLVPFPVTAQEFNAWDQEVSEHTRPRSQPGHRDQK